MDNAGYSFILFSGAIAGLKLRLSFITVYKFLSVILLPVNTTVL